MRPAFGRVAPAHSLREGLAYLGVGIHAHNDNVCEPILEQVLRIMFKDVLFGKSRCGQHFAYNIIIASWRVSNKS